MKNLRVPRLAAWTLALLLGSSATLRSQANTLLVGPTGLSFTYQSGGAVPPPQSVLVVSTGSSVAFSAAAAAATGNWLSVGAAGGTTPATLPVSISPAGLAAGEYTGSITIASAGAANSPVTIPVSLTVRSTSQLAVSPSSLSFHFQTGGTPPPGQLLTVTSNGSPVSFTVAATPAAGSGWLLANPLSGTTPAAIEVSVSPALLAAGTYTGSIVITAGGAANSPVAVNVNLTVSASPALALSPGSLTFYHQTGAPAPAPQSIDVSSRGASAPFTVTFSTASGGTGWLVPSPLSGATPAAISVAVNPSGLAAGTYTGTVTVAASGAADSPQSISVTLIVTANPLLAASAAGLSFSYQVGGAIPPNQSLTIASSGTALSYTVAASVSGGAWLAVGPLSGTTPGPVAVAVSPAGLAPGTYTASITVTAAGAANSPLVVPVRLVVGFSPLLVTNPGSLSFAFQIGQAAPAAQTVTVTSTGPPLSFTIAAGVSGGNWLSASASSATTPATFTVSVSPAGLGAGTYDGSITLTAAGAGNSPVTVPVRLVVSASALLVVSPGSLVFDVAAGASATVARAVSLTSTDGTALNFTASSSTSSGTGWLLVGPLSGATPATLNVSVSPAGLSPGTYTGSVVISAAPAANSPQTVAVTLNVTAAAALAAAPASLSFTQAGGGPPPAPAALSITSTGGPVTFTAAASTASGINWLSVTPSGGTTPATLSVLANGAGLAPGVHSGQITIVSSGASNSPFNIPVTLTVGAALSASPAGLTFTFQIGGAVPAAQTIALSAGGAGLSFTAAATVGGWLSVSPASGTTPANLTVAVNPAGLVAGSHDGVITITAPGAVNSPLTVNVRLVVAAAPATPFVRAVVNAASFLPTSVSPGQIITLFGNAIGPPTPAGLRVGASGVLETAIGETRVLFDGVAAPMIYASEGQVSAIVPYVIAGRFNTRLQVEYRGTVSNPVDLRVVDAAPGLFTLNASGTGQGAILNQNFSVNGPNNAAARGSVVMIYGTGEGQTTPAGIDGLVTGSVLRQPLQRVTVTIGGQTADVLYAGSAPGLVSGVVQINARVPAGVSPGPAVPVLVTIGGVQSQAGVTMAVQ